MFPPNDNDWITYIQTAVPNNEQPCWVDIVGDTQYPAAYYYLSPTPDPNPTEVAFRMRLNGNPLSLNPLEYKLKEFVWGVVIRSHFNAVLFTILVNASGSVYRLQVRDSTSTLVYNEPIALNSPSQPTDNVRVADAGAHFPCASPVMPDEDYFLDFTLPTSAFAGFNFVSSTYRLCYFTSTQDIVINKEFVCGMILNPPAGTPVLCVTKQIVSGPTTVCTDDIPTWVLVITLYNCGTVPVTNVVLTDTISSDIVLSSPPVFIPNANVVYVPRTATWNVGTINPGDTVALTIIISGSFVMPGHYILNSGTVTGTDLTPIIFGDHGILVYGQDQLTADKEIVSGPLTVESCKISTWTLRITVTNTGESDIPNVIVIDQFSSAFTIESGPQFTASAGTVSILGKEIAWTIDNLAGNSSETLLITVTGFFSGEGHFTFDSGSIFDQCMETVTFQDTGIDVLPATIPHPIKVSGEIRDCQTGEPLEDVSATIYNSRCKIIGTDTFSGQYELHLPAGTYTVLFEKEGYRDKFLALVLQSDADIQTDVEMAPETPALPAQTDGDGGIRELDLFAGILCQKIDAEIVYSSLICVNSTARVECLNDVIDSFSSAVLCGAKLRLAVNLEKNLVYRLNQSKYFTYDERMFSLCFPLRQDGKCSDKKCYVQVKHVDFCKEENLVYNVAHLRFIAYLFNKDDVLVPGTPEDEC